jgi:Tfp pilus assembly protein PilF
MEQDNQNPKQSIARAENFEREGDLEKALDAYSRALDVLVARAQEFAERSEPAVIDAVVGKGVLPQQYLVKFNDHLKKDNAAAAVSNAMGMIFAKMGNKASARAFFEQAIDLTPPGETYDDPHIGMEMLKND